MSNNRILTVPEEGVRIAVGEPSEVYNVLTDLIDTGYTWDQIEWEEQ